MAPWLQTILKIYSYSKQYATSTKTEIYTNGTGYKVQKQTHTPVAIYSMTKKAKIYNGEETISLLNGAEKLDCHMKKKKKLEHSLTPCRKINLNGLNI